MNTIFSLIRLACIVGIIYGAVDIYNILAGTAFAEFALPVAILVALNFLNNVVETETEIMNHEEIVTAINSVEKSVTETNELLRGVNLANERI